MKRVIKYYNTYKSDGANFSDCSTKYEVLPILLPSDATAKDLIAVAKTLGIKTRGRAVKTKKSHELSISEAVKIDDARLEQSYIGTIELSRFENGPLIAKDQINTPVTNSEAYDIVNCQEYGVWDVGDTVDGETVLVKSGWDCYHKIRLLGYDLKSFEAAMGVTKHGFHDDTKRCLGCGKFDDDSNGYTYNFRYVESTGELLGTNCGCYGEFCKSDSGLEYFKNDANKAMELKTCKELENQGKLEHVGRFIVFAKFAGITDPGREGYWIGYGICHIASPEEKLSEFRDKEPKSDFVCSLDDNGQFQSYWSLWRVVKSKTKKTQKTQKSKTKKTQKTLSF